MWGTVTGRRGQSSRGPGHTSPAGGSFSVPIAETHLSRWEMIASHTKSTTHTPPKTPHHASVPSPTPCGHDFCSAQECHEPLRNTSSAFSGVPSRGNPLRAVHLLPKQKNGNPLSASSNTSNRPGKPKHEPRFHAASMNTRVRTWVLLEEHRRVGHARGGLICRSVHKHHVDELVCSGTRRPAYRYVSGADLALAPMQVPARLQGDEIPERKTHLRGLPARSTMTMTTTTGGGKRRGRHRCVHAQDGRRRRHPLPVAESKEADLWLIPPCACFPFPSSLDHCSCTHQVVRTHRRSRGTKPTRRLFPRRVPGFHASNPGTKGPTRPSICQSHGPWSQPT